MVIIVELVNPFHSHLIDVNCLNIKANFQCDLMLMKKAQELPHKENSQCNYIDTKPLIESSMSGFIFCSNLGKECQFVDFSRIDHYNTSNGF